MRERVRGMAARLWQALLLAGIGALALAAVATLFGSESIAHSLGGVAWAAGFAGAALGLVSGAGRKVSP